MIRLFMLVVCGALLSGCAALSNYFSSEENTNPPAPLVEFEPQIQVNTLWKRRVGSGAGKRYLKFTPALYQDGVFAVDRKGRVWAYRAETGEPLWKTATKLPITGGPGVGEGLVLIGSSDGDVVALSAENGEVLWKARVSSEVLATPRAAQGVVVVRTIDGKLFGLNTKDGTRLWVYDRTVPVLTLRGTSAPLLVQDMVVAGFDSGRLVALSLTNGQPIWEKRIALPRGRSELERMVDIDAEPIVTGNTVYVVTFQGHLAAVDLNSGDILWQRDMSSHAGLGMDSENLYVTDDKSQVWALDRYNSASLWRQDKLHDRGITSPVGFQDFVVVGDYEGYVHWLRRYDGQFVARVRVDKKGIIAPPVASADTLYVYGKGGTLAALQVQY